MLQQTQVLRVVPYYAAWLRRWPTIETLAEAGAADVIRAWAGLGYNRRALRLREAAIAIVAEHGGTLPTTVTALLTLPGVGEYTAAAILCFTGESAVPVVDTNIARVLARSVLGMAAANSVAKRRIHAAAAESTPRRGARSHNLALMDLGATVCRARAPECGRCPIRHGCEWRAHGHPEAASTMVSAAPKFETTARFARGRIVDLLRDARSLSRLELRKGLPESHHGKLDGYLSGLERDGLIEHHEEGWRLPKG